MQFGQGWDPSDPDNAPIDVEASIAEIRRHEPDIVLLQEVERALPGGVQVQPPPNYERIRAALPDMHGCFAYPRPDVRELPFGIGLAILARTPLRDVFRQDLASPRVEFMFGGAAHTPTDRVLLGARTTIEGRDLTLVNTHLLAFFMLKSSSEIHGGQRQQVAECLDRLDGPVLLSGDFNVSKHDSLVEQFGRVGFQSAQMTEPTWWRRPYVLDHIFYNGSLRCRGCRVVQSRASDHYPLVADFEFA